MADWQPTASIKNFHIRAEILAKIRAFFAERAILEVETPLLCQATVTDPHIQSFQTFYKASGTQQKALYLQTSPEYAMKRLLAAGSGPIYQICKAFRNDGELGRLHNPEFSILEWYRPGFTHHMLMDEVDEFLQAILGSLTAKRVTYAEIFKQYIDIDPHKVSAAELKNHVQKFELSEIEGIDLHDRDNWLHLFMTHIIEPRLDQDRPLFIYDFPVSQAALARIRQDNPPVAERFEVYVKGIELANAYHELTDAHEQKKRFFENLKQRHELGYVEVPTDHYLLAALEHGLPSCAGIALGIDRLIMLATNAESLADVMSFSIERS